jgi:DNA-binding SARP family transcriptional activator
LNKVSPPTTPLRIRLLGGFEVWRGEQPVAGFESQKARALLAYLVCHRGRTFSRDQLAGLLWGESGPEAARHALRQAVYSLGTAIPGQQLVARSHQELGLDSAADVWLDVEAFEEALRLGAGGAKRAPAGGRTADPHHLAAAVQLYRGDFLAGFFVKDAGDFEEWQLAEQARLREGAIEALRALVESYRGRGEYRYGVHYARRLLALEPLAEPVHRELMRLAALSGHRSRALAQYDELRRRLNDELGVEPLEETRALYESILAEAAPAEAPAGEAAPIGPLVPLVGREAAWATLDESWQEALAGGVRCCVVEGEAGVGKSRLIKTFLDAATAQRPALVLKGGGAELLPPAPYGPWVEVLGHALVEDSEAAERVLAALPRPALEALAYLLPRSFALPPGMFTPAPPAAGDGRRRLFAAVTRVLGDLAAARGTPLVVFLDDLDLADAASLDLLEHLLAHLPPPAWIVAAWRRAPADEESPGARLAAAGCGVRCELPRLAAGAMREIATALVPEGQVVELAGFLTARGCGLPLAVAELVNLLHDAGALEARAAGGWQLARPLGEVELPQPPTVDALIRWRVQRLPASARRLLTFAAVAGQGFEPALLQLGAEEHPAVVEIALGELLQRWLLRQSTGQWRSGGHEPDLVLWARGARRGRFEFAHAAIRHAVYASLAPGRRRVLHAQVAAALEQLEAGARGRSYDVLAYHYRAAGQIERAVANLQKAAVRARFLLAEESAAAYDALARQLAISSSARATPATSPTSTRQ